MGVGGVIGADKVWVQGAIGAGGMAARYGQEKKKGGGKVTNLKIMAFMNGMVA